MDEIQHNHLPTSDARVSEYSLLTSITMVLSQYITETDPYILFNGLLDSLLEMTDSEYGFIGEVFYSENNQPFIKSYATTNIAWSERTKQLYNETQKKGMLFLRLDSLYGAVINTGQLVISNRPTTDPRSCGLPQGHPPLNTFMGMPFYGGGVLLGVAGIANRKSGYQQSLAESLHPFLKTCGNLIQSYRNNIKNQQIEVELHKYKERLSTLDEGISLGFGYEFNYSPPTLTLNGLPVLLTRKELSLLNQLIANKNRLVHYSTIENNIWAGVIVGESSLRSLVRRLRNKLPELTVQTVSGVGVMLVAQD